MSKTRLSGWGRFPEHTTTLRRPRSEYDVAKTLAAPSALIARGNGRAYGDSAIGAEQTLALTGVNQFESFDPETGELVAQAGVILGDIITAFLPRGWFPPVTPGTKFVTLGGMIAADVHGKNHHCEGSIGAHTAWLDLMDETGQVHRCSPQENADLFAWTIGGMGLTGVILRAAIRMKPVESGWIRQKTIAAPDLKAALAAFETADAATYSVAWIDCLATGARQGRALVMLGEHAKRDELPPGRAAAPFRTPKKRKLQVPITPPFSLLNGATTRALNRFYYARQSLKSGVQTVDWDSYFYPLDAILHWNRAYGRRGFMQFQCVLPLESAEAGLRQLLDLTARAGAGSFLAVLKRLGPQESRFSFPMEGYTLALDFPARPVTKALMAKLDAATIAHGGRFYLAKDSRMSADSLAASDPRVAAFQAWRKSAGKTRFASMQSERLGL